MTRTIKRIAIVNAISIIILAWTHSAIAQNTAFPYCPIGFKLAVTSDTDEEICYRLKAPEKFDDKFENCIGNMYNYDLLLRLNLTRHDDFLLWIEYKTLYPGGYFVDWSYTERMGEFLERTFDVDYHSDQGLDKDLCVVWNPTKNDLKSVRCDVRYRRYCFIEPYYSERTVTVTEDGALIRSPRFTYLTYISGAGGGAVRATWLQAQELCSKRNATLLQRGWRYANLPVIHRVGSETDWTVPLGIIMTPNYKLLWSKPEDEEAEVPDTEWNFINERFSTELSLVSLTPNAWHMVNDGYIFMDVICEIPQQQPDIEMTILDSLSENKKQKNLLIHSNNTKICLSNSYGNVLGGNVRENVSNDVMYPKFDGYYWCVNTDPLYYMPAISNKILYIQNLDQLENTYVIKVKSKEKYSLQEVDVGSFEVEDSFLTSLVKKLKEYILVRTLYIKRFGLIALEDDSEDVLKKFKKSLHNIHDRSLHGVSVTRLYLDNKTLLLRADMKPDMIPLMPGHWDDVDILFMRPVNFCKMSNITFNMSQQINTEDCITYTCVGDFNEGVQVVQSASPNCVPLDRLEPVTVSHTVNIVDYTTIPVTTEYTETVATETSTSSLEETTAFLTTDVTTDCTHFGNITEPLAGLKSENSSEPDPGSSETVSTVTLPTFWPTRPPTTQEVSTVTATPIETTTLRRPPQQQVNDVMDHLEDLLNTGLPVTLQDIKHAFDEVDDMLSLEEDVDIPMSLLGKLDELGARADLNGTRQAVAARSHVALAAADAGPAFPVRGLRVAAGRGAGDAFCENSIQILNDDIDSSHLDSDASEAVVHLPESVSKEERRISFVVYRDDRAFRPADGYHHYNVNSRVLSINVHNLTDFDHGEVVRIHFRPNLQDVERNQTRTCGYWHFSENDTNGFWSREGCVFIPAASELLLDTCQCTHLTHFAEILIPRPVFSEKNERALELISIIGCFVSIFGLAMIGLTALLFRSWRRDFNNKIWLNLCVSIGVLVTCFLIVAFANFQHYNVLCMFTGIALHYSVVCSFCWMLVAAIVSYRRLVLVFTRDASHRLLRACAFAYGTPFAIFGILLSVDPHAYAGRFEDKMPSGSFCYPSGLALWLAVYAPIAAALLANWTLFALIVRSVFATRNIQRHGDTNEAVRCATVSCLLVFLFGLPWVFGLFAFDAVMAYLFTFTATFQGFVLFFFFVVGNKKTRELWMNKLKIKQSRRVAVTSSSYKSSGRAGTSTVEAQLSKPRSLAADDSRFS